jgi:hypothetical protein
VTLDLSNPLDQVVHVVDGDSTPEERTLQIKLGEAHRARGRLVTERDAAQARAEQAEELLTWIRSELATARGGWRHELRCDTRGCRGRLTVTTDVQPDAIAQVDIGRGLVALALATGWGVGTQSALDLRCQPTSGDDACPACMRARTRP